MKRKTHKDFDLSQFGDDKQAAMAKMYEDTLKNFKEGSIVAGKVVEVRNNEVLVDIGYKSEGLIAGEEFRDLATLKPGDPVEVVLEQIEDDDGKIILSKTKAEQQRM